MTSMCFLLRCPADAASDKADLHLADRCHSLRSLLPPQAALPSLPLPQGWPHLSGQHEQYAETSAGKSRNPEGQIPRPPPYPRHRCLAERCGYQDGEWYARSFLRRVHTGHLCPCYYCGTERSRRYDGEYSEYMKTTFPPMASNQCPKEVSFCDSSFSFTPHLSHSHLSYSFP